MLDIRPLQSPDFSKNSSRVRGEDYPCIVCGKACRAKRTRYVYLHLGGTHVVTSAERDALNADPETAGGDMGSYPIGPDCIKQNPVIQPYLQ
jgi:hypothetical protein